jgi:hypothetical protein
LFSLTMYLSGNSNSGLAYLSFLILFAGMVVGAVQYRNKANGGYGSFGELYKVSILITLIVSAISTVYFIIFMQLTPAFMDRIREQADANMVNKGMTAEQIQMAHQMMQTMMSPTAMVLYSLFGNLLVGAILGLLAAGILIKPKPFMEEDNNTLPS